MKIAKRVTFCVLAAAIILSCKKEKTVVTHLNAADNDFITLTVARNALEVKTANIVVSKSLDSLILSYAHQMILDHGKALDDLKIMGGIVGFTIKDTLDTMHTPIIAQLDSLAGRSFDSTYIHNELASHDETMQLCIKELNSGEQLNVTAYANTLLQTEQLHHQTADSTAVKF